MPLHQKRKSVFPTSMFQSKVFRRYFLTSGVLIFLLLLMNTRLASNIYTSFPVPKYLTKGTTNMTNAFITHFTLKEAPSSKIMESLTNWTVGHFGKTKREAPHVKKCPPDFKRNHLMTIRNPGRTGNNLFQLATLIATVESTCYTAVRSSKIKHLDGIFDIQNVPKRRFPAKNSRILMEQGWSTYTKNIKSQIQPKYNWSLAGYRQSFRYFQNYSELIKSSFRFKKNITRDVIHYLENKTAVYRGWSVCMHVRRGDIVGTKKYGVSNISYISRAISNYKNLLASSKFSLVVASDDIKWCKANIKEDNTYFSPFDDTGRDLFLLTQCNHNIMTVGSFGWFGAWLNETGRVVYDKNFCHNDRGHNPKDYFPSHWIGL